ncbi:uncharacterized protein BO97DRAFT_428281 [Aspergillus homomorphus CBS 101889]|uniref:2EXR domain-containing protein n=1 Tax=Aspergillus homomorphus (strain CBS 101889) TaxID=1450537 RepID=A0A395HLI1_ASPHC|nr:hypothetical protein BO97DRAFT_428281 [Aspergillus homomorphus CBS 101889]RAL08456.1 hypothetical protein BO97DRAFT_428281 [Aspergillus homomorphus CBS 101889]
MVTPSQSFTVFPMLPAELRFHVWEDALPTITEDATMYPCDYYDIPFSPQTAERNDASSQIYYPDRSRHGLIALPQLYVNWEAHSIARKWVDKHRPLRKRYFHKGSYLFIRPFRPQKDVLYLIYQSPHHELMLLPQFFQKLRRLSVSRAAISETMFLEDQNKEGFLCLCKIRTLEVLYIVTGENPSPYRSKVSNRQRLTERWETHGPSQWIFRWEAGKLLVPPLISRPMGSVVLYKALGKVFLRAVKRAVEIDKRTFSIELVRAVKV